MVGVAVRKVKVYYADCILVTQFLNSFLLVERWGTACVNSL